MRKLLVPAFGLLLSLQLSSCSEDFKVAAPYKSIPLINGVLNTGDTVNYIRVEKAFLDESKSAVELARIADSSYYAPGDIEVAMREISGTGQLLSNAVLDRVTLESTGITRNAGDFPTTPAFVYRYSKRLSKLNRYRLVFTDKRSSKSDSAEVNIISNDQENDFLVTPFKQTLQLNLYPKSNPRFHRTPFSITQQPANAAIYQAVLRVLWRNVNVAAQTETHDSADMTFYYNRPDPASSNILMEIPNEDIVNFMIGAIGPAPDNVVRKLDSVNVFMHAGNSDLANYKDFLGTQTGITANQIRPDFTNFKGGYVLGLFASRSVVSKYGGKFSSPTIDSLQADKATIPLRIVR